MKVKANFIYLIIIAFLIALLIIGHQINKKSSASKKNEISNIVNQLKTRNNQLAKIQKNLFDDGKNLNEIINNRVKTRKYWVDNEPNWMVQSSVITVTASTASCAITTGAEFSSKTQQIGSVDRNVETSSLGNGNHH